MNQSLAYAGAALICYGLSDFVYKRAAAAGIRANHFLMAQAWIFFPLVLVYALAMGQLVLDAAALWGCVAGGLIYGGFHCFVRSLATGSVSTNAAIFRLNFVVTVLLVVVLLGEPLTSGKIAGLAFALLATWLLAGAGGSYAGARSDKRSRSLVLVALATLAFGASNFFHTLGLRHGAVPETLAVAQAVVFMPLATITVFLAERRLRPPPVTFKFSVPAAILLLGATLSLLRSVAGGEASVLVPITQMGFIVTAVLGILVLHESATLRKAIGLAAALAALLALAAS